MEVLGAPVDRALAGVRAVAATAASLTEQYAALHDAPANPDAREAVAAAAQRYEEQSAALQAALLAIENELMAAAFVAHGSHLLKYRKGGKDDPATETGCECQDGKVIRSLLSLTVH